MKAYLALFGATIVTAVACGARTGLPVPSSSGSDTGGAFGSSSGSFSSSSSSGTGGEIADAPFDVQTQLACADAGVQFVYLITEENELFSFYPPSGAFTDLGTIACPSSSTPFSMGVDRAGVAYSVFSDGNLFTFDTGNPSGSCKATSYQPTPFGAEGVTTFGMAFAADLNDTGETLYVASSDNNGIGPLPESLGLIDVKAFDLEPIGQLPVVIGSAELTGTGDGRLFGFGVEQDSTNGPTTFRLIEFDTATAGLKSNIPLNMPTVLNDGIQAWAFSYFGGDFYFFTSPTGSSSTIVSHYHPQAGDTVGNAQEIAEINDLVVGAGVSTCAPMQ